MSKNKDQQQTTPAKTPPSTTAVAAPQAKAPTQVEVFHGNLRKYEGDLKALLHIHNISPDKFIALTLNAVRRMPKLLECDPKTLFGSIMVAAELGLEPNTTMGFCHILPYKRKYKEGNEWKYVLEAQIQMGYPGWMEIMYRNPVVESIESGIIYENEKWYFNKGKREPFSHEPLPPNERGENWIATYAIAWLKNASRPKVIVLFKEDVDKIKKLSQGANSEYSPWNDTEKDAFLWMPRKTAIKQISKELPKTKEIERVYHIDNVVETGGTVRLNEDKSIELVESDYQKSLIATSKKEGKERAVNATMANIASEAKANADQKDDPSKLTPEEQAEYEKEN